MESEKTTQQTEKRKLYLDVDGVLRNWWSTARIALVEFGGVPLSLLPKHAHKWMDESQVPEQYREKWDDVLFGTNFSCMMIHKMAEPFEWTQAMYTYLNEFFDVTIATAQRDSFSAALTEHWLNTHIIGFDSPILFERNKHNLPGENAILIDDSPKQQRNWADTGRVVIGPHRGYNSENEMYKNVYLPVFKNDVDFYQSTAYNLLNGFIYVDSD